MFSETETGKIGSKLGTSDLRSWRHNSLPLIFRLGAGRAGIESPDPSPLDTSGFASSGNLEVQP
jgi:hypothetical protein